GLGGSVTAGIISARARDIQAGPYDDFLQTDAAINRGNSGGPMFDMNGNVIGVNTAIFSPTGGSIGIGFAVPSSVAQPVIQSLRETGTVRRGWLGVAIQQIDEPLAKAMGLPDTKGALVTQTVEGGPAARAGIQTGDVILSFNGESIDEVRELQRIVAAAPIDQEARMEVWRDGKRVTLEPDIALLKEAEQQVASADRQLPKPTSGTQALGLALTELTPDLRRQFDIPPDTDGVLVAGVADNSPAADQGLQPGDVIARVGREEVKRPEQVVEAIEQARRSNQETVLVLRSRDGNAQFVPLPVEGKQG
ncbi:MAG TPA: PDZ domain-containing protein, partial [Azospirillaceae bacterium]|nr:PDZ domain-containing protein [Azospirillaceae bacterium]